MAASVFRTELVLTDVSSMDRSFMRQACDHAKREPVPVIDGGEVTGYIVSPNARLLRYHVTGPRYPGREPADYGYGGTLKEAREIAEKAAGIGDPVWRQHTEKTWGLRSSETYASVLMQVTAEACPGWA